MRQVKVKKLRKYLLKNIEEVLLLIRNEVGDRTEQMDARQVYQWAKRLYMGNKLKI
jgi:hypothetical protein